MLILFLGFLLGAFAVVLLEVLALLLLLDQIRRRKGVEPSVSHVASDLDADQSVTFALNKQGVVWILEQENVPKVSPNRGPQTKVPKEQKCKKEILEVLPIKKYAKIKDHSLILTDFDGSQATIPLVGCIVEAVSSSSLSSRKWAKKYPIRVENVNSFIYNGSKICYIYLETSWEKESWCKALRLASSEDKKKVNWYTKLNEEFHSYLASLTAEYPLFIKPRGFGEAADGGGNRMMDGSSSKVRLFLKKLTKKASKSGYDSKTGAAISSSGREERKPTGGKHVGSLKSVLPEKNAYTSAEEDMVQSFPSAFSRSVSQSQASVSSDLDSDDKSGNDEGILCCNLLIARLFFDAKSGTEVNSSIQARIQRALSNMRTPSYIGGISCTSFNIGNLPPYIHSMRILPMDINEVWAMEVDIEYSGGAAFDIATRLEVREPDFQKGIVHSSLGSTSPVEVTSDLLDDFEYYGKHLKLSTDSADGIEKSNDEVLKFDGTTNAKSSTWTSIYALRWKSILNSVADQVSQVPLSLAIRITSLRGTLRLHIKPPPSDTLWFGFTSMPDIEWVLDSSVGDRKIKNGQIALLISNRIKAAIRETLVLPNCESVCIPWMLADKNDWVPRSVAPFIWIHQEGGESIVRDAASNFQQLGESSGKIKLDACSSRKGSIHSLGGDHVQDNPQKVKNVACIQPRSAGESVPNSEIASSSNTGALSLAPIFSTKEGLGHRVTPFEELRAPLLAEMPGTSDLKREYTSEPTMIREDHTQTLSDAEDAKPRKIGRRARMMDLKKKMGEKLEEKRRNIEEKGWNIVEKMRENTRATS